MMWKIQQAMQDDAIRADRIHPAVHPGNRDEVFIWQKRLLITVNYTWKTNSWKTNHAEFFAFDKFTLQNLAKQIRGCVNQPFILFTHHIRGETVLFITQTSDRMQYFIIFARQIALSQYSGRSIVGF